MTPSVREVLLGCATALATPAADHDGAAYAAGRVGLASSLIVMAAFEAEKAAGAAITENADIRRLFAAAEAYDAALGGRLARAARETDADLSLPALDAANAALRRLLIELHQAVESADDVAMDRRILELYARMAEGRRMALPQGLGG
jgi:hypothetical protein